MPDSATSDRVPEAVSSIKLWHKGEDPSAIVTEYVQPRTLKEAKDRKKDCESCPWEGGRHSGAGYSYHVRTRHRGESLL